MANFPFFLKYGLQLQRTLNLGHTFKKGKIGCFINLEENGAFSGHFLFLIPANTFVAFRSHFVQVAAGVYIVHFNHSPPSPENHFFPTFRNAPVRGEDFIF